MKWRGKYGRGRGLPAAGIFVAALPLLCCQLTCSSSTSCSVVNLRHSTQLRVGPPLPLKDPQRKGQGLQAFLQFIWCTASAPAWLLPAALLSTGRRSVHLITRCGHWHPFHCTPGARLPAPVLNLFRLLCCQNRGISPNSGWGHHCLPKTLTKKARGCRPPCNLLGLLPCWWCIDGKHWC